MSGARPGQGLGRAPAPENSARSWWGRSRFGYPVIRLPIHGNDSVLGHGPRSATSSHRFRLQPLAPASDADHGPVLAGRPARSCRGSSARMASPLAAGTGRRRTSRVLMRRGPLRRLQLGLDRRDVLPQSAQRANVPVAAVAAEPLGSEMDRLDAGGTRAGDVFADGVPDV